MEDCPTGILVEVCSDPIPPPESSKRTLEELLSELGAKYLLTDKSSVSRIKWKDRAKRKESSPSITDDDFITNEVFDFKVPDFENMNLPECDQSRWTQDAKCNQIFQFPVLSLDPPSVTVDWNSEVTAEAKKISKRISMMTEVPLLTTTVSDTGSVGELTPVASSDASDDVFVSPLNQSSRNASEDKENIQLACPASSQFVPHPDPVEALTPEGVKRIRGPPVRRGTFTLDKDTPKTANRCKNTPLRKQTYTMGTPKTTVRCKNVEDCSSLRFGTKLTPSTPSRVIPRSRSLIRTPDVGEKTFTFRKGGTPELSHNRRSSSMGRAARLSDSSFTKPLPVAPPKSSSRLSFSKSPNTSVTNTSITVSSQVISTKSLRTGGAGPLLRKALLPKTQSRPGAVPSNMAKGPIKATVPTANRDCPQKAFAKQTSTENKERRILQPRSTLYNRPNYP